MTALGTRGRLAVLATTLGLTVLSLTVVPASAATVAASTAVTRFQIQSAEDNRCLDADTSTSGNGVQIQMWDCSGASNQQWFLAPDRSIHNLLDDRCLDADDSTGGNGAKVQLWDCSGGRNQQWFLASDGSIHNFLDDRCLDADNATSGNGRKAQLWDCSGRRNQRWSLSAVRTVGTASGASAQPTTVSPAASARALSASVPFEFVNRGTIRCAAVGNSSLEDNAPVWQSSCVDDPSQNWVADSVGGGFFHFRNLNSNLCLDFARNTNGTTLKQHTCGGDVFERWQVKPAPQAPGYFTIVSAAGRCMDLDGGSPATGTKIQVWDCLSNNNQLWLLITG